MTVYCDAATTSFPKAPGVSAEMAAFLERGPASHARSATTAPADALFPSTRGLVTELLEAPAGSDVVFTLNATEAINLGLRGLLRPGDHVVTSGYEHSAVTRTLTALRDQGVITFDVVETTPWEPVTPRLLEQYLRRETRLVTMVQHCNVTGHLVPSPEVGAYLKSREVLYMLDAAQSAAAVPLSMRELQADLLAFSGHKSLLGPPGVGGLIKAPHVPLRMVRTGGTGVRSEHDVVDPREAADFETGTQNTVGLVGLRTAIEYLNRQGLHEVMAQKRTVAQRFLDGVSDLPGVHVRGHRERPSLVGRAPTVSLSCDGLDASDIGEALRTGFGVITRTGLHCSPWTHRRLGTYPHGTVRFSFGAFLTCADAAAAVDALTQVVSARQFWDARPPKGAGR